MKKLITLLLAALLLVSWGGTASAYVGDQTSQGTYTIGYWKTHPGAMADLLPIRLGASGGEKSVMISTTSQAVSILKMTGGASNGIVKLYAQLLAAKLNYANGADKSAVAAVMGTADSFLASHNAADWAALSSAERNNVLSWMTTLDRYNNGIIGPGHAD